MFETNVISLLKQIPEKNRTVLLIRHSERPSFKGIPEEKKDEIELTPKGIEMAVYITYDMAIFPLIYYLFDINKQVKFLDGIVMKVDDVGLDIGFNGETRSIEYQELKI